MANLIIDIGNTALKASWADGVTLGKTYRYQGEKFIDFIFSLTEKIKPEVMVISSVKSISSQNVSRLQNECERFVLIDENILGKYDIPEYLTPDRAASIVAARHLFKGKECMVFDFGTTLTVDFINKEGIYEGGNVSPGCTTRFKSINRYTRSLPMLSVPENIIEKGNDINTSITSGIISGIIFEIEGYSLRYPEKIMVFTGGDAFYFAKRMKNSIFAVCNLVLIGLAIIASEYDKKD